MRRALLSSALLLPVIACSYWFEASTRVEPEPLILDEVSSVQSFTVRLCWEGDADVESASVQILAADPEVGSGRATIEFAGEVVAIAKQAPSDIEAASAFWSGEELDDACEVGTVVSFALAEGAAGPAEIEWSVIGSIGSGFDESVEDMEPRLIIEPL
jgi:hypothetical protein